MKVNHSEVVSIMPQQHNLYICYHTGCRRSYKRVADWKRHLQEHEGWSHPCQWCDKTFTRVSSLNRHYTSCQGAVEAAKRKKARDATIIDVTPVTAVRLNYTPSFTDTPPKRPRKITQTAWIPTGSTKTSMHKIKLLQKYDINKGPQVIGSGKKTPTKRSGTPARACWRMRYPASARFPDPMRSPGRAAGGPIAGR